eukprot:CAMPEP_0198733232 /NCGR_PEP_ID=MMETSP1475-20131203/43827_1 /TAXON_ID= ORGANISM="Unidentified sp., Strain CCMP1999" /NCGR_SAMPLE_ID=MMETSP1475 /ASSEMBLY_ACC=CAM_ASM_001111 /LENGTH=291 /DNA_ID=CAMNT_0044496491 /DNA_START=76 /DNA_END=951 /DNA_ORIENTATION=+
MTSSVVEPSVKQCTSWRVLTMEDGAHALSKPVTAENMQAATEKLPEGAYTSLRTYGKSSFLLLDDHFARLEETAGLMGKPVKLNREELRRILGAVARHEPSPQTLMRITVGCTEDHAGETWISAQELKTPSEKDYAEGVFVVTRTMHRDNPHAKNNAFIERSKNERKLIQGRVNEVLMINDDGKVLEGLSSNFFGVKDGTVYTANEGVLPGLTRSLILQAVEQLHIPLSFKAVKSDELATLDEAFISSTSRGVLPVVQIDDDEIGDGCPGSLTQSIADGYKKLVRKQLEHF